MVEPAPTRRRLLAVLASASLAGCSTLPKNEPPALDAATLRRTAAVGAPAIDERSPAPIAGSYLDASRERTEALLDPVPASPDAAAVPNEAVRRYLERVHDGATRALERAERAETPVEAMGSLRVARSDAAAAHAAWAAVHDERTRRDVLAGRGPIRESLAAFRDRHAYVGDDPGPALILHERVESYVDACESALSHAERSPGNVSGGAPLVGETADRVEAARAFLADATHLYDRFRSTFAEPRSLASAFRRARDPLVADVTDRFEAVPEGYRDDPGQYLDRDVDGTPAASLLETAYEELRASVMRPESDALDGLATSLLAAVDAERDFRAFESLREAVEDGAFGRIESAAEVRSAKLDAVAAVEAVRARSTHPSMTNRLLRGTVTSVRYADDRLREAANEGRSTREAAATALEHYVQSEAQADATPLAVGRVVGTVRAAVDERR